MNEPARFGPIFAGRHAGSLNQLPAEHRQHAQRSRRHAGRVPGQWRHFHRAAPQQDGVHGPDGNRGQHAQVAEVETQLDEGCQVAMKDQHAGAGK
jgi:hypothetical protein